MAAELAVVPDPDQPARRDIVDGWVEKAASIFRLADHICDTDFVPRAYRGNAPAVAAAILTGRELDMGPMMALKHVQVIDGTPSLSAEYKRARVLAAGHEFDITDWTNTRCQVKGRRRGSGSPPLVITYTIEDAQRAGLVRDRSQWIRRPRRMLFARAGTDLADALFADVTNGLPTAELITGPPGDDESGEDGFGGYDEAPGPDTPKTAAPGTARRKRAAAGGKPEGTSPRGTDSGGERTGPSSPGAVGAAPGDAQPLPPLPGEEPPDPTPPAAPAATSTGTDSSTATGADDPSEPGSDRHRKLVGAVRGHFKRLGYTDADDTVRLMHTAVLAGTSELGSTNDLDEDELKAVADTLARCRDAAALKVLLDAAQAAREGGGDDQPQPA